MQRFLIYPTLFLLCIPLFSFASCVGKKCTCAASTSGLAFGNYNPIGISPNDSSGGVTVNCSVSKGVFTVSYEIQLSTGSSNTFFSRTLVNGANKLNYNLYIDAGRTMIWGDKTNDTDDVSDAYTSASPSESRSYPVYGRIPGSQTVPAGIYSDDLTATIIY